MRALKFYQTGSVDGLQIEEAPLPTPADGEVLVQVKAAAINPSDVKNVLGKMHETTVPRIPGRDFAVLPLPKNLSFEQAAGIGVAYITAWTAMVDAAQIQAGETALILGTTGAVGSAAARIAHHRGARVIGTTRNPADTPAANLLTVDDWIDLRTVDLAAGVRALTNGRGADVVFDVVGGAMFERCLAALAWRGRQVAISSSPKPRVSFNLVDFNQNLRTVMLNVHPK